MSSTVKDDTPGQAKIESSEGGAPTAAEDQPVRPTMHLGFNADGVSEIRYQWQSSADGRTWIPIPGATNSQYKPRASESSFSLRLALTYIFIDTAYSAHTVYSDVLPAVAPTADNHGDPGQHNDQLADIAPADPTPHSDHAAGTADASLPTSDSAAVHDTDATAEYASEVRIVHGSGGLVSLDGGNEHSVYGKDGPQLVHTDHGIVIHGGDGNDTLVGTDGNDTLYGGAGDDHLYGGAGNDLLHGDDGNDTVSGDADNDTVHGDSGNDHAAGGTGSDAVYGDAGNDVVSGDAGKDYVSGGDGNDRVYGGTGNDTVQGDAGNDAVHGDSGHDQVSGGTGNDAVYGDAGNDTVSGDSGNDHVSGGDGHDTVSGGDGNDAVYGDAGNDTVSGDAGNDYVSGGDGDDHVSGGDGNDCVSGGDGDDTVSGGTGNDLLFGGYGHDIFVYRYGDGNDSIMDFQDALDELRFDGDDGNYQVYDVDYGRDYSFKDGYVLAVHANHGKGSMPSIDLDQSGSGQSDSGTSDPSHSDSGPGDATYVGIPGYDDEFDYADFGHQTVYDGGSDATGEEVWTDLIASGVVDLPALDPHPVVDYMPLSDLYDDPGLHIVLGVSTIAGSYDDHNLFG